MTKLSGLLMAGVLLLCASAAYAQAPKSTPTTGACVYSAANKTYCAVVTQSQCTDLKGAWTSGGKCP
jgi:hypothetical protein